MEMMERLPGWVRQHLAALRALLVFTVVLGVGYSVAITAVAQIPGLQHRADGSMLELDGRVVGSAGAPRLQGRTLLWNPRLSEPWPLAQ